jgi:hypothetical protein
VPVNQGKKMKFDDLAKATLFLILLLASFFLGSFLAFSDKPAAATAAYAYSVFCSVLFLLARFKKFKAFGIEAELWDDKQTEAEKLVEEMKASLATTSSYVLNLGIKAGRWSGSIPRNELMNYLEKNTQIMKDAGKSENDIRIAQASFFNIVSIDLISPVVADFNNLIREKIKDCTEKVRLRHPQLIEDATKYNAEIDVCNKLNKDEVDWNKLSATKNAQEILELTLGRANRSDCLSDVERNELLERHRSQIDEAEYIKQFGKFKNAATWIRGEIKG